MGLKRDGAHPILAGHEPRHWGVPTHPGMEGMRLAYIFTDLPDKAGTFPVAELEEMAARGFEIEVFCLRGRLADGPGARRLRERFRVHQHGYLTARTITALLRALLTRPHRAIPTLLRAILDTASHPAILVKTLAIFPKCCLFALEARRGSFDLIWAYWASLPGRAAWWIAALADIPYGTWTHAGNDIYNRRHQTLPALRTILRDASLGCTCNHANLEYFASVLPAEVVARIHYQPHGIDLARFAMREAVPGGRTRPEEAGPSAGGIAPPSPSPSPSPPPLRLLSVGNLSAAKGFQHGVAACARLRDRGVDVRYRIIGEGPMRPTLESLIAELGLTGIVGLPGAMEQDLLPAEYRTADIFVMPSVVGPRGARDGLPNVLLEAMACGVPSLGSNAVGIPEAIEDGVTGRLAPPGDPDGIARVVAEMAADVAGRTRISLAARAMVEERYARGPCMDRLATVFRAWEERAVRRKASCASSS